MLHFLGRPPQSSQALSPLPLNRVYQAPRSRKNDHRDQRKQHNPKLGAIIHVCALVGRLN